MTKFSREEYNRMFAELINEVEMASDAQSLESLQEAYTNYNSMHPEIENYILTSEFDSAEEREDVLDEFASTHNEVTSTIPFPPPFADVDLDIENLFSDNEPYFERYGCIDPSWILCWDSTNILFHDVDNEIIEIIARPDVLMRG